MKKLVVILLLLSGIITTVNAQNLSKMSEKERNEKLVKEAKAAIKKYAPDYVKYTEGKYKVELTVFNSPPDEEIVYSVRFTDYDPNEESFTQGAPVVVHFRVEDGSVESIVNGHGWGIEIPRNKTRGQEVKKLEYKKRPPYKQNTGRTQTFS